jgi:large exoprotein involved in heme utilization and adhesion
VLSSDASVILGKLTANGQVILVNPNGVVFGDGAKVDVGGLVASVLDIKDSDFLAGTLTFQRGGATGSITNKGKLTAADGGYIALLAPEVRNDGVITAKFGTVALAAGDAVTLDLAGTGLVSLKVDPATVKALINNRGMIVATDGQALLSSQAVNALLGGTINSGGVIEADSLTAKGGEITLEASGPITLAGATLDASGATGGGTIKVGGWQTATVAVDGASKLDASATGAGDGGTISVIGQQAQVGGTLLAKGGAASGDGGAVETSGTTLAVAGAAVDTSAAHGQTGSWLLDPANFIIAAHGGDITGTALAKELAKTNVTILSSQGKESGSGDIEVDTGVTWSSANSLTLSAYRNIGVNAPITNSGGAAILLRADNTGTNSGTVTFANGAKLGTSGAVSLFYNPTSYAAPTDYSGDVTGGAALTAYMLVNDVNHLQAINTNLAGTYALGKNIDASATAGWNGGAGFVPLGSYSSPFTGLFDGQGNTINGLVIDLPLIGDVGLFGSSSGTIRNVGLIGGSVTGFANVGDLVGNNSNSLTNDFATGSVTGTGTGSGDGINAVWASVGGLVGENTGGTIASSHATGAVTYTGTINNNVLPFGVGGLVGINLTGNINNSYATGAVTNANGQITGGLVGMNGDGLGTTPIITNSYATGAVRG